MGCCLSTKKQQPQFETEAYSTLTHNTRMPTVTKPSLERAEPEQGMEELLGPEVQRQDGPRFSDLAISMDANEEMVIRTIRVTDVTLGLRRLPSGFYIVVHHSGLAWRTESVRSSLNDDVVEWSGPIPLPLDPSAVVRLEIYASFEFQSMLGAGEQLREITVTAELLEGSSNAPYTFLPEDGDVVSPCSSILVDVKRQKCDNNSSSASRVFSPHCSAIGYQGELEDATDQGHRALSCYRKHGRKWDLDHSVEEFERALNICPLDHPCRAAAQLNLAMAQVILCRVEDSDTLFEVPLGLYRDVLGARPVGHSDRSATLIQLAAVHFARFEKQRDKSEAAQAETLLHEAIELGFADSHESQCATFMLQLLTGCRMDPVWPSDQSLVEQDPPLPVTDEDQLILSDELLDRFEQFDDLAALQQAIEVLEKFVGSTSSCYRDDQHHEGLLNLGVALRHRFEHLGELSDLEEAISRQRAVVDFTPHDHPDKPTRLNSFGISLSTRFERFGGLGDLEEAIQMFRGAIRLAPHGDPQKLAFLNNLGNSLSTHFDRLGELSDLEEAISAQRSAVDLVPHDHTHKPDLLHNLSLSFSTRFKHLGEQSDLDNAISTLRDAIALAPHDHARKPTRLNGLGVSLSTRFERLGGLGDLEEAISAFKDAGDLVPHDHPDKPTRLSNLGDSLRTRFDHLGELSDLEDAISRLRDAVDLVPHGHPRKPDFLNNLGISLRTRFERLGEPADLQDAISILRDGVDLVPRSSAHEPIILGSLGMSLLTRFDRFAELGDLEEAISTLRNAVDLTTRGHPDKPTRLNSLGNSLSIRFRRLGQLRDLEEAISMLRDAVDLTPHGHPYQSARLNHLGDSLSTRFKCLGELDDLEEAISTLRSAVHLTPCNHSKKSTRLSSLGDSLSLRFERLGQLSDLEGAISMLRDAVNLTPRDHPDRLVCLGNLSTFLRTRFERLGELGDLEDAILIQRDAVDLTPDDHPHKPGLLNNLGIFFSIRFEHLGELRDLEDSISALKGAVKLIPHDHPNKSSCLDNLGISFETRYKRLGELRDIEQAISMQVDAVDLTPHGHPDRSLRLNNLGKSFKTRFEHLGELKDLEEAISMQRDAVNLTPNDHPDKPSRLNNLGVFCRTRFEHLKELRDIEEAILMLRDAIGLTPHGHPDKPARLGNLGTSFFARFEHLKQLNDLEQAISLYSHAASSPIGSIDVRFRVSQDWISCARRIRHHSLLHAYSVAISLLPQLAWIGLSLTHRYSELMRGADVAREAAAAALESGHPELAVEWLEQGRSIVWGELFQLRNSHTELSSVHPDHARRLRELSVALENAATIREKNFSLEHTRLDEEPILPLTEEVQGSARRVIEPRREADTARALAIERDKLLQEIRRLPGFEGFLRRKENTLLRAAAHSGPLVILNAAETRCDALIVLTDVDHVVHVPLPNFSFKRAVELRNAMKKFSRDAREGKREKQVGASWESLLSRLWKCVVKPVLDALALSTPGDLSRIFWCPTGPFAFLPIHAAGFYDDQYSLLGNKVFDFVVSSYVPTLSVLVPTSIAPPCDNLRLLIVRQPSSDGLGRLPGVTTELERIREIIEDSSSLDSSACIALLESSVGTVEEVLDLMKAADWVHFACHGVQDGVDSGLCLADQRRLKLCDLIALSRPKARGGLAFLSACQTATGEKDLADEAIHLSAGMLFAGFGGVIGTMWSISDKLAPDVARDVYERLFLNGTRPDYREAARALHEAIAHLRDIGASFVEWVPFIHVGL